MLIHVAAFLSTLGFALWVAGTLLEYHGLGMVGAALMVGVGAMTMTDGLEVQTGEVHTNTSADQMEISHTYSPVDTLATFPLGLLVTLAGGVAGVRSLAELSDT